MNNNLCHPVEASLTCAVPVLCRPLCRVLFDSWKAFISSNLLTAQSRLASQPTSRLGCVSTSATSLWPAQLSSSPGHTASNSLSKLRPESSICSTHSHMCALQGVGNSSKDSASLRLWRLPRMCAFSTSAPNPWLRKQSRQARLKFSRRSLRTSLMSWMRPASTGCRSERFTAGWQVGTRNTPSYPPARSRSSSGGLGSPPVDIARPRTQTQFAGTTDRIYCSTFGPLVGGSDVTPPRCDVASWLSAGQRPARQSAHRGTGLARASAAPMGRAR